MWEFRAYGGGDLYREIFSALALMSGANAMDSLIRLALVLGVVISLVAAVRDFNIGAILRWYIFAVCIYGVLWVPKVTVQVTDRLNPTAVYANVGNVPLGAAVPAALISQVGDRIIQLTQTAFADPADSNFGDHGMVFGAKMFAKINSLRPSNQLVAMNMASYIKNCAFYDIQDNTVNLDTLQKSNDMWGTLTATPNPGRVGPYVDTTGATTLYDCVALKNKVNTDFQNDLPVLQKTLISTLDPNVAEGQMPTEEANVSNMMSAAMGSGQGALNILSQAVTRNMLNDASKGYMSDANGVLAASVAEVQTQNTQRLLGDVAEKAVVNLKIVIELLFIGIFPAIFPLFLLPKIGPSMAKGYLAGFFYLQLWGPMYVVLHKIMMWNAFNHMQQASFQPGGTHVINALSLDAVAQANQDICALAGSMMLMIPVLAGLLTKGAMAVGAQGEALLGNFRSGAESASQMQTTGNYSFDDSNIGNHSWNNSTANQHIESEMVDKSRSTVIGADGATRTTYNSGYETMKMDLSSGAVNLNEGDVAGTTMRRQAQSYIEDSQAMSEAISVGTDKAHSVMTEWSSGTQMSENSLQGLSQDVRGSIDQMDSDRQAYSQHLQQTYHMSKEAADTEATRASASIYADAHAGGDVPMIAGARAGVRGEASKEGSTIGTLSRGDSKSAELLQNMSRDMGTTTSKVQTSTAQAYYNNSTDKFHGTRHATSDSFTSRQSMTDTLNRMQTAGKRLSEDSEAYRSGTRSVTADDTQAWYNWMKNDKGMSQSDMVGLFQNTPESHAQRAGLLEEFWGHIGDKSGQAYMQMPSPDQQALHSGAISGLGSMAPVISDQALRAGVADAEHTSHTALSFDSDPAKILHGGFGADQNAKSSAASNSEQHAAQPPSKGHSKSTGSSHGHTGGGTHSRGDHAGALTAPAPAKSSGPVDFSKHVPMVPSTAGFGVFPQVDQRLNGAANAGQRVKSDIVNGSKPLHDQQVDTKPTIVGGLAKATHDTANWWNQDDAHYFGGFYTNAKKGWKKSDDSGGN